jgi:ABC-type glycerol-3-phosphate transport system substrate-binding protein
MRPRAFVIAVVAALLVALPASSGTTAASDAVTLRVMSFNIFYGGDELNLQTRQFLPGCRWMS